jgi:hypothetical protein
LDNPSHIELPFPLKAGAVMIGGVQTYICDGRYKLGQ